MALHMFRLLISQKCTINVHFYFYKFIMPKIITFVNHFMHKL